MSGERRASRRVATPVVFVVVTVAVMAVHTLARDRRWRYEWLWAAYQYHFGVLLLGPVLCGVAAWVGRRSELGRWITRPAARVAPALRPLAIAVGATWLAYVASFVVPASVVFRSGTTDGIGPAAVVSFAPALFALAMYVAVGFAAGAQFPSWLTAPVVAVAAFALTLVGWITGAERLVRVGGSGTSMVSLRPTGLVQSAQIVLYGAIAATAAAWAAHHLAGVRRPRVAAGAPAVVAAAVGVWLVVASPAMCDHPAADDVCVAAGRVSVCAARPYEASLDRLSGSLGPALTRVRAAGAPIGERVDIGTTIGIFEPDPTDDVLVDEVFAVSGIGRCWAPETADDVTDLAIWMRVVVTGRPAPRPFGPDDPTPMVLSSDDPEAQDAWAAAALRRVLTTCPSSG